jgi:anti-sigma factor RsiW
MKEMNDMISCKEMVDLIMDYLDNNLDDEAAKAFDMHIEGCEDCHAFLNTYKKTVSLTHQITYEDIPDELSKRLSTLLKKKKDN